MNRIKFLVFISTSFVAIFFSISCDPITITSKIPTFTPTWTPTGSHTYTPTFTFTLTKTPTITNTPTITFTPTNTYSSTLTYTPTNTFTPTSTFTPSVTPTPATIPTCGASSVTLYSDDFSNSSTFSNYESFERTTGRPMSFQITGGEFLMTPDSATGLYTGASSAMVQIKDAILSHSLSNYTLEFDSKMDLLSGSGFFGAAVRSSFSGSNMSCYSFILNDNAENPVPYWQVLSNYGSYGNSYQYFGGGYGTGASVPTYTAGTWAHFKVVCQGSNFAFYVDTGSGTTYLYGFGDTTYPTGSVGFSVCCLRNPNLVHFKNLVVTSCP
ncbi:MAG TPA: hypothetical protein VHE12_03205 [bacterium]|nr:hypothetical protein [bacterium]